MYDYLDDINHRSDLMKEYLLRNILKIDSAGRRFLILSPNSETTLYTMKIGTRVHDLHLDYPTNSVCRIVSKDAEDTYGRLIIVNTVISQI